jgi:hypothetical protein
LGFPNGSRGFPWKAHKSHPLAENCISASGYVNLGFGTAGKTQKDISASGYVDLGFGIGGKTQKNISASGYANLGFEQIYISASGNFACQHARERYLANCISASGYVNLENGEKTYPLPDMFFRALNNFHFSGFHIAV